MYFPQNKEENNGTFEDLNRISKNSFYSLIDFFCIILKHCNHYLVSVLYQLMKDEEVEPSLDPTLI